MLQSNMLQNDRSRALLDSVMPREQAEEGGIGDLVTYASGFLRRQYPVIIFVTALALAASAIYLRITPPTYTGQVKVLFSNPKAPFVQQQSMLAETPIDAAQLETQIQILKSKAIATAVIDQLKLADDPDFTDSGPLPSVWQAIRRWFGTPPDHQVIRREEAMDGLVAAFDERLSAFRLGFSNVIEITFNASNADRSAEIAN